MKNETKEEANRKQRKDSRLLGECRCRIPRTKPITCQLAVKIETSCVNFGTEIRIKKGFPMSIKILFINTIKKKKSQKIKSCIEKRRNIFLLEKVNY